MQESSRNSPQHYKFIITLFATGAHTHTRHASSYMCGLFFVAQRLISYQPNNSSNLLHIEELLNLKVDTLLVSMLCKLAIERGRG